MGRAQVVCAAARVDRSDAGGPSVLDQNVSHEPSLSHVGARAAHRDRECALDLGAGCVTARVDDARDGVPALARERERAVDVVERRAERHQLAHARRAFGGEHAHRIGVVQAAARGERVGAVQFGRVGLVDQRGRDTTLRVTRR